MANRIALLTAGICMAVVPAGCSSDDSSDAEPTYLFTLETPTSEVVDGDDGTERLVIPTDEVVTWFTDRPVRLAGHMTLQQFVDDWEQMGFVADPPNAALEVVHDGTEKTMIVELGLPEADGDQLAFPITDIPSDGNGDAAQHAGRSATHQVTVGSMGFTGLFIDSVQCSCINL